MQENNREDMMREQLTKNGILFTVNEPMAKHTSFQIGGPADWFVCPAGKEQLKTAVAIIKEAGLPYFVLGNGSNLLVSDQGIRGVVLQPQCNEITVSETRMRCGSGLKLSRAAKEAAKYSLEGLEFASGIPGSMGGAVRMNAGAYGGEMADVVVSTEYLDPNTLEFMTAVGKQHEFSYRHSMFCGDEGYIICSSELELRPGNQKDILNKMDELAKRRREKQPVSLPSGGSTFKRPEGYYAAALIDQAGLRGKRVGGAQVSEKHTGFIVNTGGATAQNVKDLMALVQQEVEKQFGVLLESEICMIGE